VNIRPFLRAAQQFSIENSPSILTAIGVIGTITTAVWTGRAAYSSAFLLENALIEHRQTNRGDLTTTQKIEVVWKEFIPPAIVGALTLSAIIGANRIGARRAAALAAAFKISEQMAEEYRQKVIEHIGANKEEMVRSDVMQDRIQRLDGVDTIILGESEIIFFDSWSGRAFPSTIARVDAAVNQINYTINQQWAASLTEFFDLLGLPKTAVSDDFGWNSDHRLEPYYTSCLLPDGRPAREIRYDITPFEGFSKVGI
jgi:hypothetical protein